MITLENVSFRYDESDNLALDGISLEAGQGELVCVAGADCSGKSTLFRLLNGTAPRAFPGERTGKLTVGGLNPEDQGHAALGELVTSVFDDPDSQIISLTVEEEVAFALVQRGLDFGVIRVRVKEALARVGLAGFETRATGSLSGGQKQRLVMASAIALKPQVLLVDEGTSALDPEGARLVFDIVRDMTTQEGTTAIVIERDLGLALEYADQLLVLDRGKAAIQGTSADITRDYETLERLGLRLPAWLALSAELARRGCFSGAMPASESEAIACISALAERRVYA
jgi:energy-coupling factor transporter ATP-binding protein EcfA2